MSNDNKALIRRWFEEVWDKGRTEAIDEMLTPDAIVHGLGPGPLIGPEGFKPFHSAFRRAFSDITVHVDDVIGEGDMVAVRWTCAGTHDGDGLGFPATGRTARFSGMTFVRARDGKLIAGWNAFDQLDMLQQLGAAPAPPLVL